MMHERWFHLMILLCSLWVRKRRNLSQLFSHQIFSYGSVTFLCDVNTFFYESEYYLGISGYEWKRFGFWKQFYNKILSTKMRSIFFHFHKLDNIFPPLLPPYLFATIPITTFRPPVHGWYDIEMLFFTCFMCCLKLWLFSHCGISQ